MIFGQVLASVIPRRARRTIKNMLIRIREMGILNNQFFSARYKIFFSEEMKVFRIFSDSHSDCFDIYDKVSPIASKFTPL